MIRKIALGTAQFGLDYGINNRRGKIPFTETKNILAYAHNSGIRILDTAFAYGDSESVIGSIMSENNMSFKIVSKSPKDILPEKVYSYFYESLKRLNKEKIYGYLVHDFQTFKKDSNILKILKDLKRSKKVEKIGFSLYYPSELKYIFEKKINFDIVQVPYSLFDRRFESFFPYLKKMNIEIHTRSVFLQGLVFIEPQKLARKFSKIKQKLIHINMLSQKNGIPISSICLNYAFMNSDIDSVIIGVDNIQNLKENLDSLQKQEEVRPIIGNLEKLKVDNEKIILPINWN